VLALAKLGDAGVSGNIRLRGDTKELYFTDTDNVRVQLQDIRYRGGVSPLGDRDSGVAVARITNACSERALWRNPSRPSGSQRSRRMPETAAAADPSTRSCDSSLKPCWPAANAAHSPSRRNRRMSIVTRV
jgi:hypothetical protein